MWRPGPAARGIAYALFVVLVIEGSLFVYAALMSRESFLAEYRYVPFVEHVTRRREWVGPHGFTPTVGQEADAPALWMFGGSTVQGGGTYWSATDCEPNAPCTLPSHLAVTLRERGRPHAVFNFGQANYASTQERILFLELLGRRPPPEIAVFYHGVNDAETSANVAGYPNEYRALQARIEGRLDPQSFVQQMARARFKLAFVIDRLTNARFGQPSLETFNPLSAVPCCGEAYRQALVDNYAHNVRLIQATCREFGVTCHFFWQPSVCFKERLAGEEGAFREGDCERLQAAATRERVRAHPWLARQDRFHDVSDVLRDAPEALFEDYCHIDERTDGNAQIARALADHLFPPGYSTR